MNITIVSGYFPPLRGGIENYVYNLSKSLIKRGHTVKVICGDEPLQPGATLIDGLTVKRLHIQTKVYGTPLMTGLPRELRNSRTDIFHANFPGPYVAFTVSAMSRLKRINAVLTWHNDLPPVSLGAKFLIEVHDRLLLPSYVEVYRRVISISRVYAKRSRILGKIDEKVRFIGQGVDCSRFNPHNDGANTRNLLHLTDKRVMLFVGALTKWHGYKGLDILLRSFALAKKDYRNLALVVAGDGSLKTTYQNLAGEVSVAQDVHFVGDVPDRILPEVYAACDIFVLPSKMAEGLPLAVLEATATGKPVIGTNVGGLPEVVKHGYNGLLVRPGDERALARAILEIFRSPKALRRMGRNGRQIAEQRDWSTIARKTEQVYEEALEMTS